MIGTKKMLMVVVLVVLLVATWLLAVTGKSRQQADQQKLMAKADSFIQDEVYVEAIPLLNSAGAIKSAHNLDIAKTLAVCYNALGDDSSALEVLNGAISDKIADESVYKEVALNYLNGTQYKQGIELLKAGVQELNSQALIDLYEEHRYRYQQSYTVFDELGGYSGGYLTAKQGDKWGYVNSGSKVDIGFVFDKVTDFSGEFATAIDDGKVVLIDRHGYRNVLCKEQASDVLPLSGGIAGLRLGEAWHMSSSNLEAGSTAFDYIGKMSPEGRRAISLGGKWILYDSKNEAVTPEFEDIKVGKNGQSFAMGRAFAKQDGMYILIDGNGNRIGQESYQDAKPFIDSWAAVKQNDKWQFIDADGNVTLTGEFEEIDSYSCNLAAVKYNGLWGYMSKLGNVAIECVFMDVSDFSDGVSSVKTGNGWSVLQLKEYME